MQLAGKVALVTGGGTGIGRAISLALARNGAKVAVAGRRADPLSGVEAQLRALSGFALSVPMDITRKADVETGVGEVARAWGALDILVNNASISGMNRITDPEDSRWYRILETNLTGTYLVTKEALKYMKAGSGARIINVSSVLGKFGVPGYTAYCASKHGVIGFTRALALEVVDRGITVNAVCPGWVDTEMARQSVAESSAEQGMTPEAFKRQAIAAMPIKRFLDADEVAELVVYLCSARAAPITGQAINICGGQVMT
ncbi:MAG TPA: SDR family NAD(P)-dependent oxidoreductase [Candidatus Acidoferrales bacterium]|nr:SDR family NAD(P)-dependent oxidoreductase [Candidatus Acidoferrales bacterium]